MKYKAKLHITCPVHPEGHATRIYSDDYDDAWWLSEVLTKRLEEIGFQCSLSLWHREEDEVWILNGRDHLPTDEV